jgi:phosphate transport system substrate-binding protein
MNKRFLHTTLFFIVMLVIGLACSESESLTPKETPTSGVAKVYCEEGFTVPMKVQAYTFGEIYPRAKAEISYVNEKMALEGLYSDCCKVAVLSRKLTAAEQQKFKAANVFVKEVFIARNALALVVSAAATDSTLSLEQVKKLLSGADTSCLMVFDNQNSGVARYLKDSILQGRDFGRNCYAVKSTAELVEKVSQSKRVIGIMDYAWISDKDETVCKEILKLVRPLAISAGNKNLAYFPDQSNIETRDYPFCRFVYMVQRGGDFTPAAGFIAFVAGQKGQLMLLKAGLVPALRQERMIEINTAPLGP